MSIIKPGSTIGILGSGQLGRMLSLAASAMGYQVHIYSPEKNSPAEQVSASVTHGGYDDIKCLEAFAKSCDVVTIEFENIPFEALMAVQAITNVHPSPAVLKTFQHRLREKTFLQGNGIPCAPFQKVSNSLELKSAVDIISLPAVLKTAGFGYDGKGQKKLLNASDLAEAIADFPDSECVLEGFVNFEREVSIVAARSANGEFDYWEPIENLHSNHILDISSIPARMSDAARMTAAQIAKKIAENMKIVGVFCVEFFLLHDGNLLVNEIAPRVHNSGHLTIESSPTSQFQQHIRAVCGLKLGESGSMQPTAMANLLGDLWQSGEPNWEAALSMTGVSLHLYGKSQPKIGRKMGHITAASSTAESAVLAARNARAALKR